MEINTGVEMAQKMELEKEIHYQHGRRDAVSGITFNPPQGNWNAYCYEEGYYTDIGETVQFGYVDPGKAASAAKQTTGYREHTERAYKSKLLVRGLEG